MTDFTEAIRLNPKDAGAYFNRGCKYAEKGDYDKAIIDFTAAIRFDPTLGCAFHARGYLYLQNDEIANADADFAQAEKLGYEAKPGTPGYVKPTNQ